MSDLQEKLRAAHAREAEAAAAIADQKREAAAPALELEAASAEIAELEREQTRARWEAARRASTDLEYENRRARADLVAALEALDFQAAQTHARLVTVTCDDQRRIVANAIVDGWNVIEVEPDAAAAGGLIPSVRQTITRMVGQFVACWSLDLVLLDFVYNGPAAHARHTRAGLAYAIQPIDVFQKRAPFENPAATAAAQLARAMLENAGATY